MKYYNNGALYPDECKSEYDCAKEEQERLERELDIAKKQRPIYTIEMDLQRQKDYVKSLD
jgi:hypothetical protein